MRRRLPFLAVVAIASWSCASAPTTGPTGTGVWSWPTAPRLESLRVEVETLPARAVLAFLSAPEADPALRRAALDAVVAAKVLPAVGVDADGYGRWLDEARGDEPMGPLAGAARRSHMLLAAVETLSDHATEIATEIRTRASWLLPDDPRLDMDYRVVMVFGIGEVRDVVPLPAEVGNGSIIDPARSLTDVEGSSEAALEDLVARKIAPELYDVARQRLEGFGGDREPMPTRERRIVVALAHDGPAAYLGFSKDFLPITRWLAGPLAEVWERFGRRVRHPPAKDAPDPLMPGAGTTLWERDVALVGASMVDSIAVTLGPKAARAALADGPDAFVDAYVAAEAKDSKLPPLPEAIVAAVRAD